jgi:hypothetical protein
VRKTPTAKSSDTLCRLHVRREAKRSTSLGVEMKPKSPRVHESALTTNDSHGLAQEASRGSASIFIQRPHRYRPPCFGDLHVFNLSLRVQEKTVGFHNAIMAILRFVHFGSP